MSARKVEEKPAISEHKAYLFAIAYRMLGSISDAEDVLQECFLRWERLAGGGGVEEILAPRSYLATMVTRLCVEHLRKAHVRRETYVGPWLPEPLAMAAGEAEVGVEERHEQLEQISTAFLLMLEQLTPTERAAFLLRKAFDYEYGEIADVIEKSEANCRQLVHRAQRRIGELSEGRPRFSSDREAQMRLMSQFLQSCSSGDVDGLVAMLAEDAVFTADSDGKARASRRPVAGADRVARLVVGLMRKAPPHLSMQLATLNGSPAVILYDGEQAQSATIFELGDGCITAIYTTVNPDKLRHLHLA